MFSGCKREYSKPLNRIMSKQFDDFKKHYSGHGRLKRWLFGRWGNFTVIRKSLRRSL
jgi:hypothetical protein